jgi:hypothetical protein
MKRMLSWLMVAAAAATTACGADKLNVPVTNAPGQDGVNSNPVNGAQFLASGILAAERNGYDDYIIGVGNFGRESFNIFPTDGRSVTGWYQNFADNAGFGSGLFAQYYANLRNVLSFDNLVQGASQFTAGQKAGAAGFSRTIEGLDLYYVIMTKNIQGAPLRVAATVDTVIPFSTRDAVLAEISAKLDAGATALGTSGAALPFTFPAGEFAGFTSVAGFRQVNRALAARVLAYRASLATGATRTTLYTQALTALSGSFLSAPMTTGNRNTGPVHVYSTAAGDSPNALFTQSSDQGYYANPSLQEAFGADSLVDNRYAYFGNGGAVTPNSANVTTSKKIIRFPLQTSPIPVITNEELILTRAEARYFTGDTPGALADINNVRTVSGLAARGAFANDADFITELLSQRERSLVGLGLRWVDYRRFGRLSTLPNSGVNFRKTANQVITQQECVVRSRLGDPAIACPTFSQTDPQNPTL